MTIACTLPVPTASCERSFSTLRMVKSYLRTTVQNDRLQDLLVLGIHRSRASKLNFDDVVSRFSKKNSQPAKFNYINFGAFVEWIYLLSVTYYRHNSYKVAILSCSFIDVILTLVTYIAYDVIIMLIVFNSSYSV